MPRCLHSLVWSTGHRAVFKDMCQRSTVAPIEHCASAPAPSASCTCPSSEHALRLQPRHWWGLDPELYLLSPHDSVTQERSRIWNLQGTYNLYALTHLVILFFFIIVSPKRNPYLYDYELEHEGEQTDVSWGKVKQEWSVPHSAGPSFSFSATDHNSLVMQIYQHLVICTHTVGKTHVVEWKWNMKTRFKRKQERKDFPIIYKSIEIIIDLKKVYCLCLVLLF